MNRKFVLTKRGLDDLREIARFYRGSETNERVEQWLTGLVEAVEALAEDADRHPSAHEAKRVRFDLRQKLYGTGPNKYRILFVIQLDAVRVLRIWHGARRRLKRRDIVEGET